MEKGSRTVTKTEKSVRQYINQLHDQNSKLLALRLDFGYPKEHCENKQLSDIKRDIKHMLDNRRGNPNLFKHLEGYVTKFEYTPRKGPHAHMLLLYDGQKVKKDEHLAEEVGLYWKEKITEGKGLYHNCNFNKSDYEQCGIGMIDHTDADRRAVLLDKVVPYMLKKEQSIDSIKDSVNERSVTKGIITSAKSNAGRPRIQNSQHR
ncbi:YagK/YfjJ domain-containing protein [Simplicispira piscis]